MAQSTIPDRVNLEWAKGELPKPIRLRSLSAFGKSYVDGAVGRLHAGELEAIQLALEMKIKIVLLDDLLARKLAKRKGLIPIGVLGILRIAVKTSVMTFKKTSSRLLIIMVYTFQKNY